MRKGGRAAGRRMDGAEAPLIYRFFNTMEELDAYMRGGWRGDGLHAVPELDPETSIRLKIGWKKGFVRLEAKRLQKDRRFIDVLGALFHRGKTSRKGEESGQGNWEISFDTNSADGRIEPDLARLRHAKGEIVIQALGPRRLHAVISRVDGRILYAGGMTR